VAAEQIEAAHETHDTAGELTEIVADRGYHSNQTLIDFAAIGVRCYIAEPDRGRRHWTKTPEAQRAVYNNLRRVGGPRGRQLCAAAVRASSVPSLICMTLEHCAGLTCAGARTSSRLLVHGGAFNLGILMRKVCGCGTPRGLQGHAFDPQPLEIAFAELGACLCTAGSALVASLRLLRCVIRCHSTSAIA